MTGSFPGANIALFSVCETMNITPIVISSAGSSSWGANREELSWPYIENFLYNNKLIISNNNSAFGLKIARKYSIPYKFFSSIDHKKFERN